MGTSWSVKFAADAVATPERVAELIEKALQRVIAQMSSWDDTSALSNFHRSDIAAWYAMPPEMAHVIKTGQRIARESDGAYDLTVGRLVNLWGFGPTGPRTTVPAVDDIACVHRQTGFGNIELSSDGTRLRRMTDLHLDLSGIAKGFAVDLVAMTLRARGITDFLVEIGGELLGRGVKPDGTPWWVDINSAGSESPPIMVGLHELAIATSGCERAFRDGKKIYAHTIDPRTGWPIDNGIVSVTVLHETCMEADAYATSLMVMGLSRALAFAETHKLAALIRYREPSTAAMSEQMSLAFEAMLD